MSLAPGIALGGSRSSGATLPGRLVTLALIFALELAALSVWLDNASLSGRGGSAGFVGAWGAWIVRGIVGFCGIFATFAWLRYRPAVDQLSASLEESPISVRFLAAHFAAFAAFLAVSSFFYSSSGAAFSSLIVLLWSGLGIAAILLASLAFLSRHHWSTLVTGCGHLWLYSLLAVTVALFAGDQARALWEPGARLTFRIVYAMLRPFLPALFTDPSHMLIGTPRFNVEIAPECSGFEGAGLILSFGVLWLVLFRAECRFPRALLLIPAAVVLLFLLNSVRIAALILIGNSGAEQVALGGFHSQAGWIAFNGVALGFCAVARRLPWFTIPQQSPVTGRPVAADVEAVNPVAPWVMPFVAILAAGMLSRALTADFEWAYPLRFVAAAGTLWYFRGRYRTLDWGFGWPGVAAGLVVFAVWIGLDQISHVAAQPMPRALAAASLAAFSVWVVVRALAATVTVPIAEEFAFRGFLLRRLVSSDFESVPFSGSPWFALAISSVVFGLLHGDRWIAGAIAGVAYGLAMGRKGRIGDAVIAHGLTNALIAIDVLYFGQWQLW